MFRAKLAFVIFFFTLSSCRLGATNASDIEVCPEFPEGELPRSDVTNITLSRETLTENGRASKGKHTGYAFNAKAGQRLSYRTDDDICIWVFSPENDLLGGGNLPKDGVYTVQVSAIQGTKTFSLDMTLGTLKSADSETNNVITSEVESRPQSSVEPSTQFTTKEGQSGDLEQEQAFEIVESWLKAKPRIFGPPFDTQIVNKLTTGTLHWNTTKSDGSIAWLKNNNHYYTYKISEVQEVFEFSSSGNRPYIKVKVYEDLTLYGPNGINQANTGAGAGNFIYFFEKDSDGRWKIEEYEKI